MVSHFQQLDASSINWSTSPVVLAFLECDGGDGRDGVGVLGCSSGGGGIFSPEMQCEQVIVVLVVVVVVVVVLLLLFLFV